MKSRTEVFEVLVVELSSIVGDDGVRQSESEDDGLLDEVFHLPLDDLHQRFGFHLLSEVVNYDDYELPLAGCRRKRIEYVNPPLGKGPRGDDGSQLVGGSVLYVGIPLAWFAPPNQLSCVLLHGGPVVTLSQDFVGQGLAPQVVTADPFMYFSEIIVCVGWSQALQQGKGE